jgi:hypothetical protein
MPQSAVKTGCADRLLSPPEIAAPLGLIGEERARFNDRNPGSGYSRRIEVPLMGEGIKCAYVWPDPSEQGDATKCCCNAAQ